MLLVLRGAGFVANLLLLPSTGQKGGWIALAARLLRGVTFAVYEVTPLNGPRLKPPGPGLIASSGTFQWSRVSGLHPGADCRQARGRRAGVSDLSSALAARGRQRREAGVLSTGTSVRRLSPDLLSEAIGMEALVTGLLGVLTPKNLLPNSGFETAFAPLSSASSCSPSVWRRVDRRAT